MECRHYQLVQLPNRVFNIFMNILVLFFLLVRAECVRCPLAYLQNEVSTIFVIILHFLIFFFSTRCFSPILPWSIGPSRERLLTIVVVVELSAHYFNDYSFFSSPPPRKNSTSVNRGPSRGSSVHKPLSEDPHRH